MSPAARIEVIVLVVAIVGVLGWAAHQSSPSAKQRDLVKKWLNDPDSAKFQSEFQAPRGNGEVWCGEVNARNRMGGMAGFTRYVAYMAPYPEVFFDHPDAFNRDDPRSKAAEFASKWKIFCE